MGICSRVRQRWWQLMASDCLLHFLGLSSDCRPHQVGASRLAGACARGLGQHAARAAVSARVECAAPFDRAAAVFSPPVKFAGSTSAVTAATVASATFAPAPATAASGSARHDASNGRSQRHRGDSARHDASGRHSAHAGIDGIDGIDGQPLAACAPPLRLNGLERDRAAASLCPRPCPTPCPTGHSLMYRPMAPRLEPRRRQRCPGGYTAALGTTVIEGVQGVGARPRADKGRSNGAVCRSPRSAAGGRG
jgi:hypothetical protein